MYETNFETHPTQVEKRSPLLKQGTSTNVHLPRTLPIILELQLNATLSKFLTLVP
jgi:hypothetical protein